MVAGFQFEGESMFLHALHRFRMCRRERQEMADALATDVAAMIAEQSLRLPQGKAELSLQIA
jgi:hypothetical protein